MNLIMNFKNKIAAIITLGKNKKNLFGTDHKQIALLKHGTEQFKTLIQKGLVVPVVLL